MWSSNLIDYIREMHNVDVIWKPKFNGEEPPF